MIGGGRLSARTRPLVENKLEQLGIKDEKLRKSFMFIVALAFDIHYFAYLQEELPKYNLSDESVQKFIEESHLDDIDIQIMERKGRGESVKSIIEDLNISENKVRQRIELMKEKFRDSIHTLRKEE